MKTSQVKIVSTILLISLCGGINGIEIQLSALRSDLEYLRGYWLQNAGQSDREGRILFSNESQILVDFEKSTNPIQDEAWTKDFLRLRGIHELPRSDVAKAVDELFYKQGSFYFRENPYALPETLPGQELDWISTLPIRSGDEGIRSSVQIQYVYLHSLASEIDGKVKEMSSTSESSSVPLKNGDNAFPFDFVTGRTQLFVRHVRIITPIPFPKKSYYDPERLFYTRSEEMPSIRYDRTARKFYADGVLRNEGFIRSSVGPYIVRDVRPRVVFSLPPPPPPPSEEDVSWSAETNGL